MGNKIGSKNTTQNKIKEIQEMNILKGIMSVYDCGKGKYWDVAKSYNTFKFPPLEGILVSAGIFAMARLDFNKDLNPDCVKTLVPIMNEAVDFIASETNSVDHYSYGDVMQFLNILMNVLKTMKTKKDHTTWHYESIGGKGEYNPKGDNANVPTYHETYGDFYNWEKAQKVVLIYAIRILKNNGFKMDREIKRLYKDRKTYIATIKNVILEWEKSIVDTVASTGDFCNSDKTKLKF